MQLLVSVILVKQVNMSLYSGRSSNFKHLIMYMATYLYVILHSFVYHIKLIVIHFFSLITFDVFLHV